MKIDTFYGDSIFCHNEEDLDNNITTDNDKELDKIFTDHFTLNEGTNLKISREFNDYKKAYRKDMAKAHSHMRQKEWSVSLYYLDTAKKDIKDCKKTINSFESNMTSAILGIFASTTLSMIMDVVPGMNYVIGMNQDLAIKDDIKKSLPKFKSKDNVSKTLLKDDAELVNQVISAKGKCDKLITFAKTTEYANSGIILLKAVTHIIDDSYSIIKSFKDDKKNKKLTVEKLNIYKTNIIRTLDKFTEVIDKEIKVVKEKQKEESRKS